MKKDILIFVGKGNNGKTMLANMIKELCIKNDVIILEGLEFNDKIVLKSGKTFIINLNDKTLLDEIPVNIKRRALVFEIDKILI